MLHAPWTLPLPTTRAASSLSRRAVASRAHKLLVATLQCQCNCHFKPLLQTSTQIWLKRCPVATPPVFHLSTSQFTTTYHSIPNLNHPNLLTVPLARLKCSSCRPHLCLPIILHINAVRRCIIPVNGLHRCHVTYISCNLFSYSVRESYAKQQARCIRNKVPRLQLYHAELPT